MVEKSCFTCRFSSRHPVTGRLDRELVENSENPIPVVKCGKGVDVTGKMQSVGCNVEGNYGVRADLVVRDFVETKLQELKSSVKA